MESGSLQMNEKLQSESPSELECEVQVKLELERGLKLEVLPAVCPVPQLCY